MLYLLKIEHWIEVSWLMSLTRVIVIEQHNIMFQNNFLF